MSAAGNGPLWAITSYFNPQRYRRRRDNYSAFRARLRAPLAAIELSFDGRFELGPRDADLLVQVKGGDVMWQKERLLNLLLPRLPRECRQVVAVDCDIIFRRPDWAAATSAALSRAALVQPFRRAHHLAADADPDASGPSFAEASRPAVAESLKDGLPVNDTLFQVTDRAGGAPTPGIAWATSRELIERHGYYDACIVGGGDTALTCAAYGVYETVIRLHHMNERQGMRYLAWAESFHRDVRATVDCVDGDVFHLWHGAMADRRARDRHEGLVPFGFDPGSDIALSETGCWRWASDKPDLHRYVRDYFAARREDG